MVWGTGDLHILGMRCDKFLQPACEKAEYLQWCGYQDMAICHLVAMLPVSHYTPSSLAESEGMTSTHAHTHHMLLTVHNDLSSGGHRHLGLDVCLTGTFMTATL